MYLRSLTVCESKLKNKDKFTLNIFLNFTHVSSYLQIYFCMKMRLCHIVVTTNTIALSKAFLEALAKFYREHGEKLS